MPMKPVPPEPAVMTTVTFVLFAQGDPAGIGVPGSAFVLLRENSDVSPTSGIVPACSLGTLDGLRATSSSGAVTKSAKDGLAKPQT